MPQLIVIRLHPVKPIKGADFEDYLYRAASGGTPEEKLSITVSDLALDNAGKVKVVAIGTAEFLPRLPDQSTPFDPDDWLYDPNTRIVQHFPERMVGLALKQVPAAVATAVIPIPGGMTEYLTSDLRLEVKRGTRVIVKRDLDFNVPVTENIPMPAPAGFPALQPVSLHIALPAPLKVDLNTAIIELSEDGRPPNFDDLYQAVKTVLVQEPGIPNVDADIQARLQTLTPAEARHIAFEIMHNPQVYPPPEPTHILEDMYTLEIPGRDKDAANAARDLFEAETVRHKAVRDAQAERLSAYVYALGAAFRCQQMSEDAAQVGFKFPVHPAAPEADSASKIKQVEVILSN